MCWASSWVLRLPRATAHRVGGGLAATFAESVSMGAVAYTSTLADADFYESERAREYRQSSKCQARAG